MGQINQKLPDDIHNELAVIARKNDDCPDTLKEVIVAAAEQYAEENGDL